MFYDLNVPCSASDAQLPRTLAFLHELGYNVVALNYTLRGKLPTDLVCSHNPQKLQTYADHTKTCAIPNPLPFKDLPPGLTVLRRCTLILTESYQNVRLAEISRNYDILAVRPIDERTLQLACSSLDCDIISLDLTQRLPFWFRYKTLSEAIKSGKKFEISYAQAVMGDSGMRRNLISNATQLIRASRGRGLIISSEAKTAVACRGPWDAINLAAVWGLGQERGYEAMSKECRGVVVAARFKRTSYRGVIDVVYGGEKPAMPAKSENIGVEKGKAKQAVNTQKRKADAMEHDTSSPAVNAGATEQPLSKRQMKKQAKEARLKATVEKQEQEQERAGGAEDGTGSALGPPTRDKEHDTSA